MIKILIGGDYVPRENIAKLMESSDFSYFDEIKPLFDNADLSIINLEVPIVEREAPPISKCGPNLKTTSKVVDSMKYAGIDMVTLANNHIMDFGTIGLEYTITTLERAGIMHVGVGNNLQTAKSIKYVKKKGKVLAFINCCEHEFSIASVEKPGSNPLNPTSQYYAIQEAKQNADFVLVIVHGGHEMWQLPSPRMVDTYRFFVDAGADAVINHHQHCFSGYETYHGKPIFYGLGNLCFEWNIHKNSNWDYGYLTEINFDKSISYKIHPYVQCKKSPLVKLLPDNTFDTEIKSLNQILKDTDKLWEATQRYYDSCNIVVKKVFEPYKGRILNKLYSLGMLPSMLKGKKLRLIQNFLNCESHRDKVIHTLNKFV